MKKLRSRQRRWRIAEIFICGGAVILLFVCATSHRSPLAETAADRWP